MSKWSGFFKVVQPTTDTVQVTDNQATDGSTYGNYSWYQRLVQGSASRVSRYNEYDVMDNDVEVARALDIIAEEMTSKNNSTNLPLDIDLQAEDSNHMPPTTLMTLRAALRYWSNLHDWDNRLFKIARNTSKYGDCFFRRGPTIRSKWMFVHPKLIIGAMVDEHDITKILGYQVRVEQNKPFNNAQTSLSGGQEYDAEFVSAGDMIRFSLNDDMSSVAPFGESILSPVFRAHKQKELLEDAIIIYRTVRAPERRVFYIDVGKMPPAMTKKYLEQIKNEIRQRKIPSNNGGQTNVDSVYNAQSMEQDYFFAQRSDGKGSRVETLPGGCFSMDTKISMLDSRELTIAEIAAEHQQGKQLWVYSCDEFTGEVKPGLVTWAGMTQVSARVMQLTLDNGEHIICTPDHKFPIYGQGFVRADELEINQSMIPLNRRKHKISSNSDITYEQVYDNSSKQWIYTHKMISNTTDIDFVVSELANDPEFRRMFCERQSNAWTDDMRAEVGGRGKQQQIPQVPPSIIKFVIDSIAGKTTHQLNEDDLVKMINNNQELKQQFIDANIDKNVDVHDSMSVTILRSGVEQYGYSSWKHFRKESKLFNHRVVAIEYLEDRIPVGTLTIDDAELIHNHHTFALSCGIFTKNSGLGELADLEYFQNKVFRGLRVPISWMNEVNGGAVWTDGKVGQAYIQELRFGKYVERLQGYLNKVMDIEFKRYLRDNKINIDESMYKVCLPEATDFEKFRQAESDSALLSSYGSADGIPYMSKRMSLKRFMQWTDDEVLANEALVCEERGIDPNDPKRLQLVYGDGSPADLSVGGPGGGPGGSIPSMGFGGPAAPTDDILAGPEPTGKDAVGAKGDTSTTDLADSSSQATPANKAPVPSAQV